jgi:carboxylesterase type B
MKQSFDLTAHNLAANNAMGNDTWNARVDLGAATHGTDQSYIFYSTYTLSSSSSTTTANSTTSNLTSAAGPPGGGMGGTTVDAKVAVKMQKYLLSFVLTGNPNTQWPEDNLYWPKYMEGNSTSGTQIIFNTTFTTSADDLASEKSLFWNQVLWY